MASGGHETSQISKVGKKEVIEEMLKLTDKYDLCKGSFYKDINNNKINTSTDPLVAKCCLIGYLDKALNNFIFDDNNYRKIRCEIMDDLYDLLGTGYIVTWNDRPETTKEDVINLLKKELKNVVNC